MAFYLDDILAEPFVIEPPDTIDLDEYTGATATVVDPVGVSSDCTATLEDGTVEVTLPAEPLTVEGIHRVRVTLTGTGTRRLPDVRFVVQDADSPWHTLDSIRDEWADADAIDDGTLWELLQITRDQVLEFAPTLAEGVPVPDHYRYGQRLHSRNTWNASKVNTDGGLGDGDFVLRPFPLDWHVKQILRPKRGIPVFG